MGVLALLLAFWYLKTAREAVPNAGNSHAETTRPPNIVLIMSDDQGFETVGAYGAESYHTPRLDELAATGMLFQQAHATPVCTPTRVKIMSGRYNSRNYVGFGEMDPSVYTFGNLFQEAGYTTFIGGKWQLGGELDAPGHFGFDEYALWQVTRRGRGENPIANRYANPGLAINGEKHDFQDGSYGPDIINRQVREFITRHKDEPFLVYYPMVLPHFPYEPTPDSPDWDPEFRRGDTEEQPGLGNRRYFAEMVGYTDKLVGQVVDHLEALGLREHTLVLFTSDNGTDRGIESVVNGRLVVGAKLNSHEMGTRVPLIANWPGHIEPGGESDALICFTYFFPTIAEVAGISIPQVVEPDGQSFAPLLRGEQVQMRDWLYMWWSRNNDPDGPGDEFARTHRYKYYQDGRLYDLYADILEEHPVPEQLRTPEQQAVVERLSEIIATYTRPGFYD